MKKRMAAVFMAGLMAASLAACGSSSDSADTASTAAAEASTETASDDSSVDLSASPALSDGVLTVGLNATFPPFEYIGSDGTPTGFDVAMMNEIGSRLGVEVEIEDMDFDGIIAAIGSKVDVGATGMTITEERKEAVNFSDPYYDATQAVLVRADSTIATRDDLAAAVIDVQAGTTGESIAREINDAGTTSVKKYDQAVTDLLNGKCDAVVIDAVPAQAFVSQHPDDLKVIDGTQFEFDVEQYGIAMSKDDQVLLDAINGALADMREDGTYDKLVEDYINSYEAE